MRSGVIARKLGMTRVFNDAGRHVPVTVLKMDDVQVVSVRTGEKDGYTPFSLVLARRRPRMCRRPCAAISPRRMCCRSEGRRVPSCPMMPSSRLGRDLARTTFVAGQKVDVVGTTQGKGFAGAMKRHNFGGLRASHGVSISHRSHGSTGQCQEPGKVFKGKKMAGHMGAVRNTTQNIEVVDR